jgi:hypothetical protein
MQTKKVATNARRPVTIPQYTHDINHPLAWEPHESFRAEDSRGQAIDPPGCEVFHFGECFGFSTVSGQ